METVLHCMQPVEEPWLEATVVAEAAGMVGRASATVAGIVAREACRGIPYRASLCGVACRALHSGPSLGVSVEAPPHLQMTSVGRPVTGNQSVCGVPVEAPPHLD